MRSGTTARIAAGIAGTCIVAALLGGGAAARDSGAAQKAKVPDFFYGMGLAKKPNAADLQNMQDGGVETVRVVVDWRAIQPTAADNPFDWSSIDAQVAQYAQIGIQVVPQLISTPGWLEPTPHTPPIKSQEEKHDWEAFVTAAVQRYGPNGTFWAHTRPCPSSRSPTGQIWNEMNSPGFWDPKPNPKQYAKLLQISAEAVRTLSIPTRRWCSAACSRRRASTGRSTRGSTFALALRRRGQEVLRRGQHPPVRAEHRRGEDRRWTRCAPPSPRTGDNAALWVDEIGWGSAKKGSRLNKGLQGQAKILTQAYKYFTGHAGKLNLDRVYWYTLRDAKPDPSEGELRVLRIRWPLHEEGRREARVGLPSSTLPHPERRPARALPGIACCILIAAALAGIAQPAQARVKPGFYGLNLAFYEKLSRSDRALLKKSGLRTMRVTLNWSGVQPTQLKTDWSQPDALFGQLAKLGIRPQPLLYSSPYWVNGRTVPVTGQPLDGQKHSTPPVGSPQARADWRAFVQAAVNRYKPGGTFWTGPFAQQHPGVKPQPVKQWQVWNEPNIVRSFDPQPVRPQVRDAGQERPRRDRGGRPLRARSPLPACRPTPTSPRPKFLRKLYA